MEDKNEQLKPGEEKTGRSYAPPKDDDARWIFDYSRLYMEIRAKLKGGELKQNKNLELEIVVPAGVKPMMNDTGIEETLVMINGFVTKVQATTIYEEERILEKCKKLDLDLSMHLAANMERYEIPTTTMLSIIVDLIMDLYEANLRKSLGGYGLRLLGESETVIERREPKRGGLLGRFL